jgi:putative ubiquitin-RnfH superfamily antitoxin RatB of RatAB toxin-antitoxin module
MKHCLVAVDAPRGPWLCALELSEAATLAAALEQARRLMPPEIGDQVDWESAAVGVWGVQRDRSAVPADGERIEVYRPLTADPRQRRRQQARGTRRGRPSAV